MVCAKIVQITESLHQMVLPASNLTVLKINRFFKTEDANSVSLSIEYPELMAGVSNPNATQIKS